MKSQDQNVYCLFCGNFHHGDGVYCDIRGKKESLVAYAKRIYAAYLSGKTERMTCVEAFKCLGIEAIETVVIERDANTP